MRQELIAGGSGGQGVMMLGKLLAVAAMRAGLYVTYMPAYGAEVRGGTANCTVIISDEPVASPVSEHPTAAVIMNEPSLVRFTPTLAPRASMVLNSSLVSSRPERDDLGALIEVPATEIAVGLGSPQVANMVALGAHVQATGVVSLDDVISALPDVIPARHHRMLQVNEKALRKGAEAALSAAVSR